MKNAIDARVSFSYRGEDYAPSMTIDLDSLIKVSGDLSDFYSMLARYNNIDTYSYLYEVMESSEIYFDNAKGLAADCVADGKFDLQKFELLRRNQQASTELQQIAKKHMGIADIDDHPGLMDALLEAYQTGKSSAAE